VNHTDTKANGDGVIMVGVATYYVHGLAGVAHERARTSAAFRIIIVVDRNRSRARMRCCWRRGGGQFGSRFKIGGGSLGRGHAILRGSMTEILIIAKKRDDLGKLMGTGLN
jgi:hypothetical protein